MIDFQSRKPEIHSVLVIKPRAIGDVLLSTPVLPNLRDWAPDCRIDFLVERFAAPVLNNNPFLDNVLTYDVRTESSVSIISRVRKNKYDLIIDLFANPRTAIITALSGAKFRVGFPFKWRKVAYNILVEPRSGIVHNVEFNLDALRRLGIPVRYSRPLFYLDENSKKFAARFVAEHNLKSNKFITVNIGGGWQIKRWGASNFRRLSELISRRPGLPVVVLYGPSEAAEAAEIARAHGVILAPPTSLHEMGAVMKSSLLLVTNDSGPMHIAAALDIPTLAIFGPTSPRLQGPYGNKSEVVRNEKLDCLECNLTRCSIGNLCMTQLEPETVLEKLLVLISRIQQEQLSTKSNAAGGIGLPNETV